MRIAIVNDMPMASEVLRRMVLLNPDHQIAWVAGDGATAVSLCARDRPDLILMDIIMPGMDGVEATRRIMASTPCSILIVTVSVDTHASRVFEAMGHGAIDAIDTPELGSGDIRQKAQPLLNKIAMIQKLIGGEPPHVRADSEAAAAHARPLLVAIGASAGGPVAISTLLEALPEGFPAAIVIVQHVDARFAPGMANWLDSRSRVRVRLAREGEPPARGCVLLAGTEDHLRLGSSGLLGYTPEPRDYAYRPSIDVFFRSVAKHWRGRVIGVLLTGMGSDGARGLRELRDRGHYTIAQDEASSAVYGIPKAAAAVNAAVDILPLPRIAPRIVSSVISESWSRQ